ncbi:hypothetical protein B0J13DRAFT_594094 [Dactylonectria estremocensis]|uniref:DUF7580 domain-containing protein n=1 Tax=Dactylonectria estremocensis TaxID=1079267 RepID=A0A9P9F4M7_9HYPO|nr:hypothetical protein B0J13DRAFT_594094 [Dactylonectria estremocensis]
MSGIEAVGIVVGTIPLLVTALEAYCGFMRDRCKIHSEQRSLNRQLTTERAKLYNVCTQLISNVIRQKLWSSYSPFEETVVNVKEVLDSVIKRLSVQVTREGQVTWVDKRRMTREFKKLLYRLNRKDYKDSLDTISKCISDLEGFARFSIILQPGRQKLSRGKLYKVLRDLASSIWRALHSSISCDNSHHITETPPNVKTAKPKKGVSFNLYSKLSFTSSTKPLPLFKSALAIITELATNIAYIKTPPPSNAPLDLCMAVKSGCKARPVCYGHLTDSGCTNRYFQVCPLDFTANSDDWSIISLHDVLEGKQGLRPLISLVSKVRLALSIASSVLQLSKTPWLPEVLTSKNVHFFRRGSSPSYAQPFLLQNLPECSPESSQTLPDAPGTSCTLVNNPTLLALGILLLEIISGSSLENWRESGDKVTDITRDLITAHKLLECTEAKGLDDDNFRQKDYDGVVMELETLLNHMNLSV